MRSRDSVPPVDACGLLRGGARQRKSCLGVRVGGPGAQGVALGGGFLSCGEDAWMYVGWEASGQKV